jgi:DNA-binding MarR family transcriptional regulator
MVRKFNYSKDELISAIGAQVQAFQDATDQMDEAVARRLRLNRTDLRCLSVLSQSGAMTAGALAEAAGLTRGAMTTALDRLEAAGQARRVWDQADRRTLRVEMTGAAQQAAAALYGPLAKAGAEMLRKYSIAELAAVRRYLEEGAELQRVHARRIRQGIVALIALLVLLQAPAAPDAFAQEKQMDQVRLRVLTQGKVCPDPDRPCEGFKPNELSFAIAKPFAFDRGRDRSQPFYAVILKSAPLCSLSDDERVRAQKQFPGAKVFLHRYFCEDFGDKVTYSNVNPKVGFVAVFAGETEADAARVVAQAKAAGYSDANLRKMEVIVVYQLE